MKSDARTRTDHATEAGEAPTAALGADPSPIQPTTETVRQVGR